MTVRGESVTTGSQHDEPCRAMSPSGARCAIKYQHSIEVPHTARIEWFVDVLSEKENIDWHPAIAQLMRWFTYDHLPIGAMRDVSAACSIAATNIVGGYELEGPEVTAGLRKLLEAKDCFVRAAKSKIDEEKCRLCARVECICGGKTS